MHLRTALGAILLTTASVTPALAAPDQAASAKPSASTKPAQAAAARPAAKDVFLTVRDANVADAYGETPLHKAVAANDNATVLDNSAVIYSFAVDHLRNVTEAYRRRMLDGSVVQGVEGMVADIAGYSLRPWGFDPADVSQAVLLGYGLAHMLTRQLTELADRVKKLAPDEPHR